MKWRVVAVVVVSVAAVVTLRLVSPDGCRFLAPCPFHWATGLHCPGCGSLRALHQLAHGHLGAALALNPLMVLMIPYLGLELARELSARPVRSRLSINSWMLAAVIAAFWIARNIPAYPFTLLAPH